MTTLIVRRKGTSIQGLSLSGHSGFAPNGSDIVCAAISTLITVCANALESVADVRAEIRQDEENAVIELMLPEALAEKAMYDAQIILRTVVQGFEDIGKEYPKYLKIIDGRQLSC